MDREKINQYEKAYYQNYIPVPFKTRDGYVLNIYPVTVMEWELFNDSTPVLTQDKSKINDAEIIQMSYLEFLYNLINVESMDETLGTHYRDSLFYALDSVLKDEHNVKYTFRWYDEKVNLVILDSKDVVKCKITPKEFNNIIDIIMTYNYIDYDDRRFSDDVMNAISEHTKRMYKGMREPTLEEKKAFVISKTGMDYREVNNMPYRLFSLIFKYNLGVDSYIGDKIIQGSYKYKVDNNIIHPLYEQKKDILSEVFSDSDAFKNKISEGAKA